MLDDLPELPIIKDATVGTLRLEGTLAKRLPQLPTGSIEGLSYSDARRIEAEQFVNDLRESFGITKAQNKRSAAIAKAKARQRDRELRNSDSGGNLTRRKLQGRTQRASKSTILRNARDYLGMGTDLYR